MLTVVDILKGALARAEAGEVTGVAVAIVNSDLSTTSAWSMEHATLAEMLGSVAILNARLLEQSADG